MSTIDLWPRHDFLEKRGAVERTANLGRLIVDRATSFAEINAIAIRLLNQKFLHRPVDRAHNFFGQIYRRIVTGEKHDGLAPATFAARAAGDVRAVAHQPEIARPRRP